MQELADRFAAYVAHRWPGAEDVRVSDLRRIHGGASRETWRLRLGCRLDGDAVERRLILRRDPVGSLIETDREREFEALRAFRGSAVPVPEVLWLEGDGRWLERPFFVMDEIGGCEASPQALFMGPLLAHRTKIGEQKWRILGALHRADPAALGLDAVLGPAAPGECWRREIEHWERVIDEDALAPQPIARAALRWLRRQPPPPPARLHVVHGDFRTGNFLVDPQGTIRGILDWEMVHLGDPLEDLAWSLNRTWQWTRDGLVGGLLPRERAVALWEEASGLRADPAALHWWELFASMKGLGIWLSSGREFAEGKSHDLVLGFTSWWLPNAQDRAILETMGRL
jgi:aminoglycoside phosphotransferase (APT) family kinase protein